MWLPSSIWYWSLFSASLLLMRHPYTPLTDATALVVVLFGTPHLFHYDLINNWQRDGKFLKQSRALRWELGYLVLDFCGCQYLRKLNRKNICNFIFVDFLFCLLFRPSTRRFSIRFATVVECRRLIRVVWTSQELAARSSLLEWLNVDACHGARDKKEQEEIRRIPRHGRRQHIFSQVLIAFRVSKGTVGVQGLGVSLFHNSDSVVIITPLGLAQDFFLLYLACDVQSADGYLIPTLWSWSKLGRRKSCHAERTVEHWTQSRKVASAEGKIHLSSGWKISSSFWELCTILTLAPDGLTFFFAD